MSQRRVVRNAVDSTSEGSAVPSVSLGIDLGTTNSVAAIVTADAEPQLVQICESSEDWTLPSVVAFKQDGSVLVGSDAKRQASKNPKNTFYSVKRIIGKEFDDVQNDFSGLAYDVVKDEDGGACIKCEHADTGTLFPEEISAYILAKLLAAAEEMTGAEIDRAVISVPAYFDEEQRDATMAAARIAGLQSVKLIKEPVASALAYGLDLQEDQTVLVFDLGGGTFDVSLLELGNGVIEVLSTGGDPFLGGDDWDAVLMDHIDAAHLRPHGVSSADPRVRSNLRALAESAKLQLSTSDVVALRIPIGGPDGTGANFTLSRQLLDELSVELYRRCRQPVDRACWQAGVDLGTVLADHQTEVQRYKSTRKSKRGQEPQVLIAPKRRQPVSEVLLVGGATRMPSIQKFVHNMTGLKPRDGLVDPDAAVATGAAVYAGILSGHIQDVMVMETWQAALLRALIEERFSEDSELKERMLGLDEGEDGGDSDWGSEDEEVVGGTDGVVGAVVAS